MRAGRGKGARRGGRRRRVLRRTLRRRGEGRSWVADGLGSSCGELASTAALKHEVMGHLPGKGEGKCRGGELVVAPTPCVRV